MRNEKKMKGMKIPTGEGGNLTIEKYVFETIQHCKISKSYNYREKTIEILKFGVHINKKERAYFAFIEYFKLKFFSTGTKVQLYTTIVRLTLTYECKVCSS